MKIASIQTDIIWENSVANKVYYDHLLKNIQQIDLIVFPEMFTTGFSTNNHEIAELAQGDTLKWMQEHARNLKTCIIGSVAVKQGNNLYNRLYVVKANEVKFYDKRYLFSMAGEDKTFTKGKKELIFDINSWKIKPLICYDLRFPVWSKNKVVEKNHQYDILIYIANWPQKRSAAWTSLLRARAIENSSYVVGVNRLGIDGNNIKYDGSSRVFDFKGKRLDSFKKNKSKIAISSFSKTALNDYRKKFPVLSDADNFTFHFGSPK
ncbi:MAG: amidohydrolase [Flavobacteriales bacterium]|nr:amidohydrolase [Flavobacteriales bacterium]